MEMCGRTKQGMKPIHRDIIGDAGELKGGRAGVKYFSDYHLRAFFNVECKLSARFVLGSNNPVSVGFCSLDLFKEAFECGLIT